MHVPHFMLSRGRLSTDDKKNCCKKKKKKRDRLQSLCIWSMDKFDCLPVTSKNIYHPYILKISIRFKDIQVKYMWQ